MEITSEFTFNSQGNEEYMKPTYVYTQDTLQGNGAMRVPLQQITQPV